MAASASVTATERELGRVQAEIGKLVQALKDGVPVGIVKDPLIALEMQQTELRARLDRSVQPPPLLHPNMADLYREKVTQLARALEQEESRTAAAEALRGLIDAIVLTPQEGELKIELQGNLAAMLKAAQAQSAGAPLAPLGRWGDERSPGDDDLVQIMLVAGARNHCGRRRSTAWRPDEIEAARCRCRERWRPGATDDTDRRSARSPR